MSQTHKLTGTIACIIPFYWWKSTLVVVATKAIFQCSLWSVWMHLCVCECTHEFCGRSATPTYAPCVNVVGGWLEPYTPTSLSAELCTWIQAVDPDVFYWWITGPSRAQLSSLTGISSSKSQTNVFSCIAHLWSFKPRCQELNLEIAACQNTHALSLSCGLSFM